MAVGRLCGLLRFLRASGENSLAQLWLKRPERVEPTEPSALAAEEAADPVPVAEPEAEDWSKLRLWTLFVTEGEKSASMLSNISSRTAEQPSLVSKPGSRAKQKGSQCLQAATRSSSQNES